MRGYGQGQDFADDLPQADCAAEVAEQLQRHQYRHQAATNLAALDCQSPQKRQSMVVQQLEELDRALESLRVTIERLGDRLVPCLSAPAPELQQASGGNLPAPAEPPLVEALRNEVRKVRALDRELRALADRVEL